MAYNFKFDLSKLSQSFFTDLARFSERRKVHSKVGSTARAMIRKFNVERITGLPLSSSLTLVEDMIDVQVKDVAKREEFLKTNRRAILFPHCARKYVDYRCKAEFMPDVSSYSCRKCSPDCLINKATVFSKKKGYDVYVLPGGSAIRKSLSSNPYEGVICVACAEEVKLAYRMLEGDGLKLQSVPLIKNGCSATKFSIDTLTKTL